MLINDIVLNKLFSIDLKIISKVTKKIGIKTVSNTILSDGVEEIRVTEWTESIFLKFKENTVVYLSNVMGKNEKIDTYYIKCNKNNVKIIVNTKTKIEQSFVLINKIPNLNIRDILDDYAEEKYAFSINVKCVLSKVIYKIINKKNVINVTLVDSETLSHSINAVFWSRDKLVEGTEYNLLRVYMKTNQDMVNFKKKRIYFSLFNNLFLKVIYSNEFSQFIQTSSELISIDMDKINNITEMNQVVVELNNLTELHKDLNLFSINLLINNVSLKTKNDQNYITFSVEDIKGNINYAMAFDASSVSPFLKCNVVFVIF